MEIMPPRLQGTDDSEEFPVIDIVVLFCRDKRLREIGTGMPVTV